MSLATHDIDSVKAPHTRRRTGLRRALGLSGVAMLALALSACASAKISQFDAFSTAGVALTDAMPELYDASFVVTVASDAATLQSRRGPLSKDDRRANFDTANTDLLERRKILDDLSEHAGLLGDYFAAINALAKSDAPATVSKGVGGVVSDLEKLAPKIKDIKIGGTQVTGLLEPLTEALVRAKIGKTLDDRFRKDAPLVENELALHASALHLLAEAVADDVKTKADIDGRAKVREPFAADAALPGNWAETWRAALTAPPALPAIKKAADAMDKTRKAFTAIAKGELTPDQISLMLADVSALVDLVAKVEGSDAE